jgi:hypothetical protein
MCTALWHEADAIASGWPAVTLTDPEWASQGAAPVMKSEACGPATEGPVSLGPAPRR